MFIVSVQIYLHVVFAVSQRACVIHKERKEELQKYIARIIRGRNQKLIAISCMPDHIASLKHVAPTELEPSAIVKAINIALLTELDLRDEIKT
jgi:putative transposase